MARVENTISISGGTSITVVANYSALPDPTTVSGKFYWCENSQGTSWLPGSLGGTYYNSGMYYSNGVSWSFVNVPYQATQSEVNTGTNTDKFVTPSTLSNSTWAFTSAKVLSTVLSGLSLATGGSIISTDTILIAFGKVQNQINSIQTSLTGKLDVSAGANFRLTASNGSGTRGNVDAITGGRALKSDANGIPTHFDTATEPSLAELAYVKGVRSSIQSQIDALRLPIAIDTGNRTHTGTVVETVVASLQIPANTLDAVCNLFMPLDYGKTSGGTVPIRLYRNTTNVLGGATQIALYNTGSNRNGGFLRKMLVRGTSLDLLSSATTSLISNMNVDLLFTATDTQTIAPSGNIWILVTVALDATGTVFTTKSFAIEKQKLG